MMGLFSGLRKQFTSPPEPDFPVTDMFAVDVRPGMTVIAFCPGSYDVNELWPDEHGQWPVITEADHWESGEGGQPTIYIGTNDVEGHYPCRPDDLIRVAAEQEG